MLGDVLLLEEKHRRAAAALAARLRDRPAQKLVVAIGGESGCGKSELAHELARALGRDGRPAKILHVDDYYRVPPRERKAWREEHGLEAVGDDEIDWDLLGRHVAAFRAGAEATLPCVDLVNGRVDRLLTDFADLPVLVVEGLYAMRAPADLKVFIDLTYRDTEKAQLLRGKETADDARRRVLEREHRVVSAHRELADLVVTADYELAPASR